MHSRIRGELRVECCHQESTLSSGHDSAAVLAQYVNRRTGRFDPRRTDEDPGESPRAQTGNREVSLERGFLTAIRVPAYENVHSPDQGLVPTHDLPGKHDQPRAGSENREPVSDRIPYGPQKPGLPGDKTEGCALASRDHQPVQHRKLFGATDLAGLTPDRLESR